jgi:hypothetical protein
MAEELSEKWRDFQAAVYRRAEQLTLPYSHKRQPIPLSKLVAAQRVTRVEFDEMATDGGLLLHDDGFEIHVACESNQIDQFRAYFLCGDDHLLPPKARFTIAHELTHTFLYDLRPKRPKSRVGRHRSEHESLERTCNRGAARLLLPERLFEREFKSFPMLDAKFLRDFAKQMRVSPVTLVRRLKLSAAWAVQRVGAIYVSRDGRADAICAAALDTELSVLLPGIKYGADIQIIVKSSFSSELSGDSGTAAGGAEWPSGPNRVRQELVLTYACVAKEPLGYLITIQCLGRLQTTNTPLTDPAPDR